jgi:hypothetical protein
MIHHLKKKEKTQKANPKAIIAASFVCIPSQVIRDLIIIVIALVLERKCNHWNAHILRQDVEPPSLQNLLR